MVHPTDMRVRKSLRRNLIGGNLTIEYATAAGLITAVMGAAGLSPTIAAATPGDASCHVEANNPHESKGLNRPGVSGDLSVWEGWVHVGEYVAEVSAGVAGSGGADGRGDPCGSRVGVGGDG